MPQILITLVVAVVMLAIGGAAGYYFKNAQVRRELDSIQEHEKRILSEARKKTRDLELQAKDNALEIRQEAENEAKEHIDVQS